LHVTNADIFHGPRIQIGLSGMTVTNGKEIRGDHLTGEAAATIKRLPLVTIQTAKLLRRVDLTSPSKKNPAYSTCLAGRLPPPAGQGCGTAHKARATALFSIMCPGRIQRSEPAGVPSPS
jgi:hypothetical protein